MSIPTECLLQAIAELTRPGTLVLPERPPTLQEIGDRFGVTRERIRQLLDKKRIAKPHTKQATRVLCRICGAILRKPNRKEIGVCAACIPYSALVWTTFTCSICDTVKPIRKSELARRLRGSNKKPRKISVLFCSRHCLGVYIAKTIGFGVNPPLKKYPGEGTTAQRRRRMGLCWTCTRPAASGYTSCEMHLHKSKQRHHQRHYQRRTPVLKRSRPLVCVTCCRCGVSFQADKALTLANEARHGTKNHYCKACYPLRRRNRHSCEMCGSPS